MTGTARRGARSRASSSTDGEGDRALHSTKPNQRIKKDRSKDHNSLQIFDVNLKALLGLGVFTFLIALFFIYHLIQPPHEDAEIPRVVTPFPAPKVMDLPMFQGEHKESLYWGTYRPHVYLGIRTRNPQSLIAGLMWIGVKDGRYFMRHVCQDADELNTYGWTHHNGRDYGHQVLVDQEMTLATSFLKYKGNNSGYGGDWAVRIDVQTEKSKLNEEMLRTAHLFFYVADESGNALRLGRGVTNDHQDSVLALGSRTDVGGWELHLKSTDNFEVHYSGFKTPHIHNLSELVQENLGAQARNFGRLQLPDTSDDSPNILVFQISATTPFKGDIAFVSGAELTSPRVEERVSSLTGTPLTGQLNKKQNEFDEKFRRCFNQADKLDLESMTVGKAAIANLLGGIGYFYGQSKISLPKAYGSTIEYVIQCTLVSACFLPKLTRRWDIHICLDIIGHWLDLMNIDGWIPREQILGAEALSKVPEEFVLQHSTNGNPPTLFLVLHDVVCSMKRNKYAANISDEISSFLERSFVRLEAWFQWFNTTQSGKDPSSYFWHGRDNETIRELNPKTLSSGLDDYPRASHPSREERHLDLRCWMLLAADCMHSISELLLKESELGQEYGLTAKVLSDFDILNQMHFDNAHGAYFDYGNHTEQVRLSWKIVEAGGNYPSRELVREVVENPILRLVPHIGYVSLFPFMRRIIPPQSWILEKQLDLISNRSTLWTDFGLRSLARTSSMYMKRNTEHDPPYWRGPIWMNMNYMILSSLHHYAKDRISMGTVRSEEGKGKRCTPVYRLDVACAIDHGRSL
ncbi:hypothetical protein RJ639_029178 [Escallonia herrerae]|uniref:Mannosyl-oligosaccharide glucosidase n=1 Tax=Escallonia herrerae TaxID=1293975 RepID=A0AA88X9L6_9ASTE|nr:hypothetical protein RJ639_029178 [Escallonia herrerae]